MSEEPSIEVVAVDGTDCAFALFARLTPDGVEIRSNANGLSRKGAIIILRNYADALENNTARTEDL